MHLIATFIMLEKNKISIRNFLSLCVVLTVSITLSAQQQDTLNQFDSDSNKHGYWIKKYPSGDKEYEGYFEHGKPIGKFSYYSGDGVKSAQMVFHEDGSAEGKLYYENEQVAAEGTYSEPDVKSGEWTYYDRNGNVKMKVHYENDKRNGDMTVYYAHGQIARETSFEDGLETGYRKEYFPDGKLKMEGKYVDGNPEGLQKFYYPDGKLKQKGYYRDAVKDSMWVEYDERGLPELKKVYDLGKLLETEELQK